MTEKLKRKWPAPNAEQLKLMRRGMNLTQDAFCARFGFPVSSYVAWEEGARTPKNEASLILWLLIKFPNKTTGLISQLEERTSQNPAH